MLHDFNMHIINTCFCIAKIGFEAVMELWTVLTACNWLSIFQGSLPPPYSSPVPSEASPSSPMSTMTSQSSMSSLAKQRQSWLDLVSHAGPTVAENTSFAQVHTQGGLVQEASYCSESAAALTQVLQTSVKPAEDAAVNSGENLSTHNTSKHTQFLQTVHKYLNSKRNVVILPLDNNTVNIELTL